MYSKEESAAIKKNFWTTLGRYLKAVPSAEGILVNWINYRTGIKQVFFRMDVYKKTTYIGIELHHDDEGIRELFFEQFLELKTYLHSVVEEEWVWEDQYYNGSREISRIYTSIDGYNIHNKDQWPEIISFLKPRIIKLDEFWADAKYSFDSLVN